MTARGKYTFRLSTELAARLADYSARARVPQAQVVEAAIASHLSPDAVDQLEAALARRLDRMSRRWLDDASVGEVMRNPDGRLWIDRLAGGLEETGDRLSAADGERMIRLVAHHVGAEAHPGSPRISAELPGTGSGSRVCCRRWWPVRPSRFGVPPSRCSRSAIQQGLTSYATMWQSGYDRDSDHPGDGSSSA